MVDRTGAVLTSHPACWGSLHDPSNWCIREEFRSLCHERHAVTVSAQFIGVCSSAKTCEIDENLRFVSDSISRLQERLIDASALIRPPALQRRTVSSLHSYAALERAPAAMSPVPEPRR